MISFYFLISIFVLSLFGNLLIFYLGHKVSNRSKKQIQNIHNGEVSRLGGVVMFFIFSIYVFFYKTVFFHFWLISLLIIIPAFIEDINFIIKPKIRFYFIIFASTLLIFSLDQLPHVNLRYLNFLNNYYFQIIFFTLALATLINGQNIIDGTNGLSAMSSLSIFGSLLYIGVYLNDLELINICVIMIILLLSFLIFNYPLGKIFLGDMGSYFLGLLAGYLTIDTFGRYNELSAYSALIIVYYPCLEIVFSYIRRIIQKKSPFHADNLHLHYKLYYLLLGNNKPRKLYNALVAPLLGIIWISPIALISFTVQLPFLSILAVLILIFIYLFMYFIIPKPQNIKLSKEKY